MRRSQSMVWCAAVVSALLVQGMAAPRLCAQMGTLLAEYDSSLGTTPEFQLVKPGGGQYWVHEGRCLGTGHEDGEPPERCPSSPVNNIPCYFMGSRDFNYDLVPDNNCLIGIGCRKNSEHYNAPEEPQGVSGSCSYTEWIAFDDGVNPGVRPLTIWDSTIPGSPPWGAPFFLNAPTHSPLRVVTGDGNNVDGTLPINLSNNRNRGKAKIRGAFSIQPGVTSLTLVCNVAAGPRSGGHSFIQIRAFDHHFNFGVDGTAGGPTYGQVTFGGGGSSDQGTLFSGRTVLVAQPGTPGPHEGEFFLLRAVLFSDGSFTAWLNDDPATSTSATVTAIDADAPEVQLTPDANDATMWFDYVRLYEGHIFWECPNPVPDLNRDGRVDQDDDFYACMTGPGATEAAWDALSELCKCLDRDGDHSIDMNEFGVFQRCLTLGAATADPACDD